MTKLAFGKRKIQSSEQETEVENPSLRKEETSECVNKFDVKDAKEGE